MPPTFVQKETKRTKKSLGKEFESETKPQKKAGGIKGSSCKLLYRGLIVAKLWKGGLDPQICTYAM